MDGLTVIANIVNHECLSILRVDANDAELSINDRNRELGMDRVTRFLGA